MSSRISRKLDLKLLGGMTGLCINESRQQQIGWSAHHLESFICDCLFQRLVRLAMCAKQSTRPPPATNDTTHTTTNIKHMCAVLPLFVSCCCANVSPSRVLGASSVIMGGATQMMTVPCGMSNKNWMCQKMSGTRSRIISALRFSNEN